MEPRTCLRSSLNKLVSPTVLLRLLSATVYTCEYYIRAHILAKSNVLYIYVMPDMQRQCTHAWRGRSKRKPKKRYIEQRGEMDGGGEESRSIESRLRLSSTCLILSIFRKNRFFSSYTVDEALTIRHFLQRHIERVQPFELSPGENMYFIASRNHHLKIGHY
jgi:hypothetical protein